MSFARWRHFIIAHGSNRGYPWAVLSLEQGLTIFSDLTKSPNALLFILLMLRNTSAMTASSNVADWFSCMYRIDCCEWCID